MRPLFKLPLALLLGLTAASCAPADVIDEGDETVDLDGKGDSATPVCTDCKVIVFVWDGLRPDAVTKTDTPNLVALASGGVTFVDHHSTYPTFTMMNAASFATGGFPGTTGFYGNTFWQPGPTGANAGGQPVDYTQPVFSEDYAILQAVDTYYQGQLLMVGTLFESAQHAGLSTAVIGKSGPAFLQDRKRGGIVFDEKMAWPQTFVAELQGAGVALPKTTPLAYASGAIMLAATNGDPTAALPRVSLADNSTSDPTDAAGAPPNAANAYLMDVYLQHVLAQHDPALTVIWLRNPDSTEHTYGVGTPNFHDALRAQDALLGKLVGRLAELGLDGKTDLIVVSDHAHSNVAGAKTLFPLRAVVNKAVAGVDPAGYAVSGYVRLADLLTRAGFKAFDGGGCGFDPIMGGIKADGSPVYATRTDADGTVCGTAGKTYTTPAYKVPSPLPPKAIVIAANGGSDYLYFPDHDSAQVQAAVRFLQQREEYGAIFVNGQYGLIPGTLPMDEVILENLSGRTPDVVVSFSYDAAAEIAGFKGTEYNSSSGVRGMHGSFSPIDVHNTLVASGPHFRKGFIDLLPSGNVDVAPTIARILHLPLAHADGRPLYEALAGRYPRAYGMAYGATVSDEVHGLSIAQPTNPDGHDLAPGKSRFQTQLFYKDIWRGAKMYRYFDMARAIRR